MRQQVHERCPRCGRLLVPVQGQMPPHRTPPAKVYGVKGAPLTGKDAPWCAAGATS